MFIKTIFLLSILAIAQPLKKFFNIKIEQYNFCPNLKTTGKMYQNTSLKMTRDGLEFIGGGIFTKDIVKPIVVQMKIMKCENQQNCVDENLITITDICRLYNFFPMMNKGLGEFFTPKLKCPIKHGEYFFNFTIPIAELANYPMGTALRKFKVLMIEKISPIKNEYISCWSGLVRTLPFSNKRN